MSVPSSTQEAPAVTRPGAARSLVADVGERGLPGAAYFDRDHRALEETAALRAQWLPVARVDELPGPGAYKAFEILGEQLVAVRDWNGAARVLSNVCTHQGMTLAEGSGRCDKLVCGYHLWSFQLDGSLSGAPLMGRLEPSLRAELGLAELRSSVWQGWLLANLDGTAAPLAQTVPGLDAVLADWRFDDLETVGCIAYECDWNWKVAVENFSEYYDHLGLHRETLEPLLPARTGRCLDNHGEAWSSSVIPCTEEYALWQGEPMEGLSADTAGTMQIFTLFSLLCAGGQPGSAFWMNVVPSGVESCRVEWHAMVRPGRAALPDLEDFREGSLTPIDTIQAEDTEACKRLQVGYRSRGYHPGPYADLELPLRQFHRWLRATVPDPAADEDA